MKLPAFVASIMLSATAFAAAPKPVATTSVVNVRTPGHQQKIEADISGVTDLYLVVQDGGDGFACDWANWVSPTLSGPDGELRLTSLKWKSATSQWGNVHVNRNAEGGPLQVAGKPIADGIGTHANSVIHYQIPAGYKRFSAVGAIDNGGSDQGGSASIKFAVYTSRPKLASSSGDASRDPEDALAGLAASEGLEATLFAAEPMLLSPSNIDVDHRRRY